uniref:Uncharacterized protein n=1 Tax=Trichuris muris TaxID=70415 RepID=A0A5S6QXW3_TRIMR
MEAERDDLDCLMFVERPASSGCSGSPSTKIGRSASVPPVCDDMLFGAVLPMLNLSRSTQSLNDLPTCSDSARRAAGLSRPSRKRYRSGSSLDRDAETRLMPVKLTPRLNELKREASVQTHIALDYAGEKFMRDATQLTNSWGSFFLEDKGSNDGCKTRCRANSLTEPVHVLTPTYPSSCSPSPPTRQCYSPSMQQVVRNAVFSDGPSTSPARNCLMRSLSPIAMQPSRPKRKSVEDGNFGFTKRRSTAADVSQSELSFSAKSQLNHLRCDNNHLQHSLSTSSLDSESGCSSGGGEIRKLDFVDAISEAEHSSEEQSDVTSPSINSPPTIVGADMEI